MYGNGVWLIGDVFVATDVNECETKGSDACKGDASCVNVPSTYSCACPDGFQYNKHEGCEGEYPSARERDWMAERERDRQSHTDRQTNTDRPKETKKR